MSNKHHIDGIGLGHAAMDYIVRNATGRSQLDPGRFKFQRHNGGGKGRKPGSGKKRVTLATVESLAKLLED